MGNMDGSKLIVLVAMAMILIAFVGMIIKKAGKALILPALGLILIFGPMSCAALTK